MRKLQLSVLLAANLFLFGCAGLQAVNTPLEKIDLESGYRPFAKLEDRSPGKIWLTLAFSGGGTRAAAFAYGVLEELRDTLVHVDGKSIRLLDEVDTISAVSGGSFPAAYYGLFGDRIFDEFEEKFLNRNIQRALILRALRPWNMLRLLSPSYTRSMLALDFYNREVFDKKTFADLAASNGPHIHINATDLSHGYRFTFNQGQFDVICSDLDVLPVATAVAASSAVPLLLSPITLRNYAGRCGYELPPWIGGALESRESDRRRYISAQSFFDFMDSTQRPYIHLLDGGIADHLGLRFAIELTAAAGGMNPLIEAVGVTPPSRFVVIVVNAETDPNPAIDLSSAAPSFAALMASVSGSQIRRYNLETLLLAEESIRTFGKALAPSTAEPVEAQLVEVSFDAIPHEEERSYFKRLPTSFELTDDTVANLRAAGRKLLRENPEFQELLQSLK
jgi:NTE family protein